MKTNVEQDCKYIDLVHEVQEKVGKTRVWSNRVISGNTKSIGTLFGILGSYNDELTTAERRDLRSRFVMYAPIDVLVLALRWLIPDKAEPAYWGDIIYSPIEKLLHGTVSGASVDTTGMSDEVIARLAAIKLGYRGDHG